MFPTPSEPVKALKTRSIFKYRIAEIFKWVAHAGVLVTAVSLALPAAAKEQTMQAVQSGKAAVSVELSQHKVVKDAQGKERLAEALTVKPGDVLEYEATYTNHSAKPVTGLVAELPLAEGLSYQRKSARPGDSKVKAATKEGAFAAEPLMRKVGAVQQQVPYSEYRTLRWTLDQLQAGAKVTVSARALVQTYAAPTVGEQATVPESASSSASSSAVSVMRMPVAHGMAATPAPR